jgi:hypothetical protein
MGGIPLNIVEISPEAVGGFACANPLDPDGLTGYDRASDR